MPQDSGAGEKTEDPTPKKMQDARREGQVSFSTEVNTAVLLLTGFVTLLVVGPGLYRALAGVLNYVVTDGLHWNGDHAEVILITWKVAYEPVLWSFIMMGVIMLVGVLISVAQVGLVATLKPLVPKASRISPASGFQRLFGLRGLMRFVFSLLKLSIVVTVAWFLISDVIFAHLTLSRDLAQRFVGESWILWILAMILAGCLMAIGIFDMLYQRFQHHKDLMMTKQEIKEEFKQSEGDPLVKAKVRQIQRQMAQQRMMQEVPGADVVITNPTHVAVALKYDAKTMAAPVVVAKGYDAVAQRIKKLAAEHGVVMVENVPLARSLAKKVEIGHPIPTDFFQAVAEVLSTVYRLKGIDPGSGRAA